MAHKGTLELLEAFAGVDRDLALLHLVGRDNMEPRYSARVRARLDTADLADRVVCHQRPVSRAEVDRVLPSGGCVRVLPQLSTEPYGTVYGEALWQPGCPSSAGGPGNLPHLADDGREDDVVPTR